MLKSAYSEKKRIKTHVFAKTKYIIEYEVNKLSPITILRFQPKCYHYLIIIFRLSSLGQVDLVIFNNSLHNNLGLYDEF